MAGDYYCNADNAAGDKASVKVILVVRFPPIIVQFSEVAVVSDATVTLNCDVSAYPLATIYWTTPNGLNITENRQEAKVLAYFVYSICSAYKESEVDLGCFEKRTAEHLLIVLWPRLQWMPAFFVS